MSYKKLGGTLDALRKTVKVYKTRALKARSTNPIFGFISLVFFWAFRTLKEAVCQVLLQTVGWFLRFHEQAESVFWLLYYTRGNLLHAPRAKLSPTWHAASSISTHQQYFSLPSHSSWVYLKHCIDKGPLSIWKEE